MDVKTVIDIHNNKSRILENISFTCRFMYRSVDKRVPVRLFVNQTIINENYHAK